MAVRGTVLIVTSAFYISFLKIGKPSILTENLDNIYKHEVKHKFLKIG